MNKSCRYCGRIHGINDECARKPKREYNIRADKAAVFRRTNRWKCKSIEIMQRDLYLCRHCLACGKITTSPLSVHHIVPLSEDFGGRLDDTNLITLCDDCHKRAERGEIERAFLAEIIKRPAVLNSQ